MSAPATPPIIIIKKKGGHAGHHGGAWKVAYADFVTAMMAFFIVMWLLNASQEVQKAVAGYFQDPRGSGKKLGSSFGGTGESVTVDRKNISALKNKLEQAMKETPKFEKLRNNVQMMVTGEGLRIELIENAKGMFFENGQAKLTDNAHVLLVDLAGELGTLPNKVLIEGHTDAKPFSEDHEYSNWELSSDRANAARKVMEESGLKENQVVEIRGFADQSLRLPGKPEDPSNRRISIIVKYADLPPGPEKKEDAAKEGEGGGEGESKEPPKGSKEKSQVQGKAVPPSNGAPAAKAPPAVPAKSGH